MRAYVLVTEEEAKERGYSPTYGYTEWEERNPDSWYDDWKYDLHLYQLDEGTDRWVASDGGEPEDNTFGRDWGWVPAELHKAYDDGFKAGRASA